MTYYKESGDPQPWACNLTSLHVRCGNEPADTELATTTKVFCRSNLWPFPWGQIFSPLEHGQLLVPLPLSSTMDPAGYVLFLPRFQRVIKSLIIRGWSSFVCPSGDFLFNANDNQANLCISSQGHTLPWHGGYMDCDSWLNKYLEFIRNLWWPI